MKNKTPNWLKSGLIGAVIGLIVSLFMFYIFSLLYRQLFLPVISLLSFYWLPINTITSILEFLITPIAFILDLPIFELSLEAVLIGNILFYVILFFIIGVIISLKKKK